MSDHFDHEDEFEDEPVEAYCVRCRETTEIEDAEPVWTRRGLPATRGTCPSCGGVVFRLGKTDAHDRLNRPSAVKVGTQGRLRLAQETIYIAHAPGDAEFAEQLGADLEKMGMACWLHEVHPPEVNWAGGVHPSLQECLRMIYVLSPDALREDSVEMAWRFFKAKNKPVVIAQVAPADPPDALRRRPRFDFRTDYKSAFRQMLQALSA